MIGTVLKAGRRDVQELLRGWLAAELALGDRIRTGLLRGVGWFTEENKYLEDSRSRWQPLHTTCSPPPALASLGLNSPSPTKQDRKATSTRQSSFPNPHLIPAPKMPRVL